MNSLPADVRYSGLTWNCPLSESAADGLLDRLKLSPATTIVDIGCGWGELLVRAAQRRGPVAAATGVDTDAELLTRCAARASAAGVHVELVNTPGNLWRGPADRAICVGSSHVFGGTRRMLEGLARAVPRGRVLVGDTCWERPPSRACLDVFGEELLPLERIAGLCRETGWRLLHFETATRRDWDAFESGHRAGPREWLLSNAGDDRAASVEEDLEKREDDYFGVYRGTLGFVFMILAR
ncbi:SAM-dependent methyltransferase [Cordyceps fumosorosea ARSEF 2679]|uniref:SAM-dependent methyltransferase n=1 Tax=Cordyceps fumosorosea (strain ARSEF 2679) TaxID=1081104 RepID=A0A167R080_CORFA|nr:SAM-dependent methyltransferase [Cordyceps fumosorosea ARSEF 2679]OAA58152.1 SAM-dependent methyltransferase [Cordyceps fumosorosea ARSEF 2679]